MSSQNSFSSSLKIGILYPESIKLCARCARVPQPAAGIKILLIIPYQLKIVGARWLVPKFISITLPRSKQSNPKNAHPPWREGDHPSAPNLRFL